MGLEVEEVRRDELEEACCKRNFLDRYLDGLLVGDKKLGEDWDYIEVSPTMYLVYFVYLSRLNLCLWIHASSSCPTVLCNRHHIVIQWK